MRSLIVRADWDDEAKVWVATSTEIDGLAVEADTLEALSRKVELAVAELIELNGLPAGSDGTGDVPVHIMAERLFRVPVSTG